MLFDLTIRDCLVVDPLNNREEYADVAVLNGKIVLVAKSLAGAQTKRTMRFPGMVLMPGLIDCHTHLSNSIGGIGGFSMLARAGVTTAFEVAGPTKGVLSGMKKAGSGINVAILETTQPSHTIQDDNPSYDECMSCLNSALSQGAIGLKLLGGHYPLTEEGSINVIKAANDTRSYIAVHSGSKKNGSNLTGALDSIAFAQGRPFQLAHVNAYCRGMVIENPLTELDVLAKALEDHPEIVTEFHLAPLNGVFGKCVDGIPKDAITHALLKRFGFEENRNGIAAALASGTVGVVQDEIDGTSHYAFGAEALAYWEAKKTDCLICFPVNDRDVAYRCATTRNQRGSFAFDALATDGGGVPRNFLLELGYLLVQWGAWSRKDFVRKTSLIPSRIMGLSNKGHLSEGADADITVFDPVKRTAVLTMVAGNPIYLGGVMLGEGGTVLCTQKGVDAVRQAGLRHEIIQLENCMIYAGRDAKCW